MKKGLPFASRRLLCHSMVMMKHFPCQVLTGADLPECFLPLAKRGRTALLTNATGVNRNFRATADLLAERQCLSMLFSPEHGVRGELQAGIAVDDCLDSVTGVPVRSLFQRRRFPEEEDFARFDVLFCDLQEAGARFYTYLYTLADCMTACAGRGVPVVVLDRPAPLGGEETEGILLEEECFSGVGRFPIPARHGMTIGEFARYVRARSCPGLALEVIPCRGWRRDQYFPDTGLPWIMPSPNLPTPESALIYVGSCMFEGTALSEGRGTCRPFELIGSPGSDGRQIAERMNAAALPGVWFRPVCFTPAFSKHAGVLCSGVQLHVTERTVFRPVASALKLLEVGREMFPQEVLPTPFLDLLIGTADFRLGQRGADDLIARASCENTAFRQERLSFLLPDYENAG